MLMEIAYGVAALAATPTAQVHLSELGKAGAQCRPDENGPAIIIDVAGLKDRVGLLKLEVWPPHDDDFLQDANVLVAQGKIFRRLELPLRRDTPYACASEYRDRAPMRSACFMIAIPAGNSAYWSTASVLRKIPNSGGASRTRLP
jgi:hypothetical protein